ncbi:hypothetical protein JB92DRAFT_2788959 [Gautieria morchelliformis]|nr:hypothetical protein JB92DRAFT_2788959 [Gautieria morchelliformis]
MHSSSSSHYVPSGGYDDLRLPPIRNPASYSSTPRAHAAARHVTTMEPPTFTSSTGYPRGGPNVTLPPLVNVDRRPRTALGHSSHTFGAPLPFGQPSHHPSYSSHAATLPPVSARPSSHRRNSLSVATANHDPRPSAYPAYSPSPTSAHHPSAYHNEGTSPVNTRAFVCDICGAAFSRAYDCKRHRDIHTRQGGHECPTCHKSLSRADALKRHMERGCSGGIEEEDPEEIERERERDRERRREKRHSTTADSSKYYYTSSHTRHR